MRYAIITDHNVKKLYGSFVLSRFSNASLFSFPAGEQSKTSQVKEGIETALLESGYNRDTTIVALGGGVVTDLAGFIASTFCRGVDLILIPTTLLAMVDAAIGGKTGINTPYGKNMIGTLYFPKKIVLCPSFLSTLPAQEMWNGRVEMLKHALIADAEFFHKFYELPLEEAIERAIEIKRRIVARDATERGVRRLLNLGHTLGHALEAASNFSLSHGEAVAAGIVLEAKIALEMGVLSDVAFRQIAASFPPVSIDCSPDLVFQFLKSDKKSALGTPRFVLLREIGSPFEYDGDYCSEVPFQTIQKVVYDASMCAC